jgi:hypothetical protein
MTEMGYVLLLKIAAYVEQQLEDLQRDHNITIAYRSRPQDRPLNLNPAIIADLEISSILGQIGVWSGQTSDITILPITSGNSLFEFHDNFEGFEDVAAKIEKALQLFRTSSEPPAT